MFRYSLRRLLYFIGIVAVVFAMYRVILFDVKRCNMAVGVFGPTFEHNGVVYDREVLHSQIALDLPALNFRSIKQPDWAEGIEISGSSGWTPTRSNWYIIERSGARNYLHLTSAHDGLAMDIWVNEGVMYHQLRNDPDQALAAELKLSDVLVTELHSAWTEWCNTHHKDRITMR